MESSRSMTRGVVYRTALVSIMLLVAVTDCDHRSTTTTTPPKGVAVNLTLDVCGRRKIQNPTESDIRREVYALDTNKDEAFLILGPTDMTYIQATGDRKHDFIVEYQDSDVGHHYRAKRKLTTDQIVTALVSYSIGSEAWKRAAEWEHITW